MNKLFFLCLLVLPFVQAASVDYVFNSVDSSSYLLKSTTFLFSKAGTDTSVEYLLDLKSNQVVPVSDEVLQKSSSFLYQASENENLSLSVTGMNDVCVLLLFSGNQSFSKNAITLDSIVPVSLQVGDKLFVANAINKDGTCKFKIQVKDKVYGFEVFYSLFPYLEDYISTRLTKTDDCSQYFMDEKTGIQACYSDYKNLLVADVVVGSCSDQEFLALDLEGCKTRLLREYKEQHDIDLNALAKAKSESDPENTKRIEGIEKTQGVILTTLNSNQIQSNNFADFILKAGILLVVAGFFGYIVRKRNEINSIKALGHPLLEFSKPKNGETGSGKTERKEKLKYTAFVALQAKENGWTLKKHSKEISEAWKKYKKDVA